MKETQNAREKIKQLLHILIPIFITGGAFSNDFSRYGDVRESQPR